MRFQIFEPDIEVFGPAIVPIVEAFARNQTIVDVLVDEGLGSFDAKGDFRTDATRWYPQDAWLRAFARIAAVAGPDSLFKIGTFIPDIIEMPACATDIRSGIRSIDIGYHLHHRKRGVVMFSTETGVMLEGIGHYGYAPGDREIVCVCNTPYPCEFDHGIIRAMARKFEPQARIVHDESRRCREAGANSCTYVVSW
jgi:hypothetical protein